MRKLGPSDYHETAWKNGGGTTAQIAAFPHGAGLDDFFWRISMARVERDGAFSRFQGVDRSLVLLSGHGIILRVGDEERALHPEDQPFRFDGDASAFARLVHGPIVDFNVMTRRAMVEHEVLRLQAGAIVASDHLKAVFGLQPALLWIEDEARDLGHWETLVDVTAARLRVVAGEVLAIIVRETGR